MSLSNFRPILPNTLTFRLTLWYASAFVLYLALALSGLYLVISSVLDENMHTDLNEDITEFRLILNNDGLSSVKKEILKEAEELVPSEGFIRLLDSKGTQMIPAELETWQKTLTKQNTLNNLVQQPSKNIYETIRLPGQDHDTRAAYGPLGSGMILHVGESIEQKDKIMGVIFTIFNIMFVIVVPLASGIGWLMARQAVRGISEVSNAALAIEKGELDRRVIISDQQDEVQNLADTFNAMAERIKNLILEMREMTDNIAHDLRRPLGHIRAISETMLYEKNIPEQCRTAASDTLEECDRLIQMINSTLDVAEAESRLNPQGKEKINIASLTEDACELFGPVAEQVGIDLTSRLQPDCNILGDREKLQRMLANLLDNAIKYTPPQGRVNVDLENKGTQIVLKVSDNGIGIPVSDQQRVFDRFYRCDQSRSKDGCGLGLSFARAVARAHGGDITLTSIPSECSIFTVCIPC